MLDLVFAGHQQDKQFQKYRRLVPHHLLYRLATALPEGGVHFPDGVGVKRMTRAMDVAGLCKNDRCLWPREGFSAANVLTPEQQPQALKSDSCVVAGRAVEDGGDRTEKDEGVADLMTTPWVTGRARGMRRVWAASCFPNAPGAHSFRGRGARPSSPYQTGNARKGLRPCRASLYGIADLVFWIKARVVS